MTKKEEKQKRIAGILDAAIGEFVERGYENASMESIAARAGLTKGGLYYHFSGKDDILIKANERFMEPLYEIMDEVDRRETAAAGLEYYIRSYLHYWSTHHMELSFVFLTMTKALTNRSLWPLYSGYTGGVVAFLGRHYARGLETGEFVSINPENVSLSLMSALDGIVAYLVLDDTLSIKTVTAQLVQVFITNYRGNGNAGKTGKNR